jgi:hypothetical protein
MSDDNVPTTPTNYPKTGLVVAATVLPILAWSARQIWTGAQNAFNGKTNDPVSDDEG